MARPPDRAGVQPAGTPIGTVEGLIVRSTGEISHLSEEHKMQKKRIKEKTKRTRRVFRFWNGFFWENKVGSLIGELGSSRTLLRTCSQKYKQT